MVSPSVPAIQQQLHVLVSQDVQPLDGFTAVYKCMLHVSLQECVQLPYVPVIYKITHGLSTSD